jgi:hypothetical protein
LFICYYTQTQMVWDCLPPQRTRLYGSRGGQKKPAPFFFGTPKFQVRMTDLKSFIHTYNTYDNVSAERYFTVRYGGVPSTAKVQIPLSPPKESFTKLHEVLDTAGYDIKTVYKDWTVAKHSNIEDGDDYVDYAFLASETNGLCVEINVFAEIVNVQFYFDNQSEIEEWVFLQINNLRNTFSKKRKPVFRVLSRNKGDFRTKTIDIDEVTIDLEGNYNEDLTEVDSLIQRSIEEKHSGLILLHGVPGTGKTSYIKTLLARHMEEKFIFIPNDFVDEMLKPEFITFLITQKNSILVIEDAESVIMSRNQSGNKSVVSTILQITDGLFSDYLNIKVICTFNTDVARIDQALFRKGRMIAFYEFKELAEDKAMALVDVKSPSELPETRTLSELYNSKEKSFNVASGKRRIGFGQ